MSQGSSNQSGTEGFSAGERAAMKARAAELKAEARSGRGAKKAAADEAAVVGKIAEMAQPDRALAERLHKLITAAAPELSPRLWYGQPAYANAGKVVCFFRSGQVDGERYSTLGFTPEANLDDGGLWPTSFAITELTTEAEQAVVDLVTRAVG